MDEELPILVTDYPHRVSTVSAHLPKGDLPEPGDKSVPYNGLSEILAVVAILKAASIHCCAVHNCALIYFGAKRIHTDWVLCVPTEDLDRATNILLMRDFFKIFPPFSQPLDSLVPIYPRLKRHGVDFRFQLHPSYLYLIDCTTENIEHSSNNVPYPRLAHYAQSLLETNEVVKLADLIDGMNLTEEWGVQNLNLDGFTNTEWANWKINELIKDGAKKELIFVDHEAHPVIDIWKQLVKEKEKRCGIKYPLDRYETRFRKRNAPDPRTLPRNL